MPQVFPLDGTDATIYAQISELRKQIKDLGSNIVALPYSLTTWSTGSLAASGEETGIVSLSSTWLMLQMQVNRPCRVRLYDTTAHRDADVARARGVDPVTSTNPGVMLDWGFQTAGTYTMTPPVPGTTVPASSAVPYTIDNLDSVTGVVTVTFTFVSIHP